MSITRRSFVKASLGASGLSLASRFPLAQASADTSRWSRYEITTEISIESASQRTQAWVPLPLVKDTDYFKTVSINMQANGAKITSVKTSSAQARMVHAVWPQKTIDPSLTVVCVVNTRERTSPLAGAPDPAQRLSKEEIRFWTKGTELLPVDGIVKTRADEILAKVPGGASDIERSKAIYNWVVDNTFRDPKTRGCGIGDVKTMLETGNLSGKCADLNALYVALARALGIPARDVYGVRVADSSRGYKSLGKSGDISKAQHCRAEFFAAGYGWIAVDPADVRKVVLEESGGLPLTDARVVAIRDYLFGNWEMNWMAFNYDHDIVLPGSALGADGRIGYLMYPQAEVGRLRLDSLDPEGFRYKMTAKAV